MQRGLVRRYFTMCCSIILTSIILLGVIFMVFAAQYFKEDKLGALEKNAKYAAEMTERYIISVDGRYQLVNNALLTSSWIPMAKALDADIYLANLSGDVLLCTHRSTCNHMVYGIEEEMIQKVKNSGCYTEVGKMGEIYKSSYYTAGVPLTLSDGQIAGVIFASSSAQGLTEFMGDILKMFLLSALVMLVVTFALVYVVTGNMVRPLREMLKATEAFAKGDFSVRVPIREQDEIGKLSMAFNNMADSLAQQETVRRSFIANVSHELKTPLTSISGYAEIMMNGLVQPSDMGRFSGKIYQEAQRLITLVGDIIRLSQLDEEKAQLEKQPVDLHMIASEVVKRLQDVAKKNQITLMLTGKPTVVNGNPQILDEMIYNLCDNAIKYNKPFGEVEVNVSMAKEHPVLTVEDDGIGIPVDDQARIFERFYRVDKSHSRQIGGTGLGLSIVKHGAIYHKAKVELKSALGEGTTVRIVF